MAIRGRVEDKVAFVTGAARGQGRSNAVQRGTDVYSFGRHPLRGQRQQRSVLVDRLHRPSCLEQQGAGSGQIGVVAADATLHQYVLGCGCELGHAGAISGADVLKHRDVGTLAYAEHDRRVIEDAGRARR